MTGQTVVTMRGADVIGARRGTVRKAKIRWGSVLSAAVTVLGIVSSPAVLAILPAKIAALVTAAGAVCQAITKPVARDESER